MKLATWPNLPQSHRNGPAEQSFAQGRLWFLSRLHPQSAWYHTPVAVRLRGPLQINALHRALQALEERHESLRTTFTQHDGVGLQVVQPFEPKKLEIIDMAGATRDALQQALQMEQTTPLNLETEPGWRTSILRLGEEDHVLSIVMHHIITDGWSIGIIQRELAMFYSAACQGIEPLSQSGRGKRLRKLSTNVSLSTGSVS
ncbi:Nonribosomal peptide synthetase dtxS1 [Beauveria bassiana]|uniref:Nonribosomal peptide synthetase dtxS1 n=1 Tax=Beauveria bassiana TaxID=176275 RepID=A0A2N6NEA0_BEABA|nr:Nonribosomal peptide synthetase dtxS1 [Beauveria bassiana]